MKALGQPPLQDTTNEGKGEQGNQHHHYVHT
jgi:hypothetical protein